MSGTAQGKRELRRCTVALDSGMTVSIATGPDGRGPAELFASRERAYQAHIDRFASAIEAIFDELELDGRTFAAPSDARFAKEKQRGTAGLIERVTVELAAELPLDETALHELAVRVGKALGVKYLR